MKSELQNPGCNVCYLCGATATETHHIFYGAGLRKKSEEYGMTVRLCRTCHTEGVYSVHKNHEIDLKLKREAEKALIKKGWSIEQFRSVFRKNYLDLEE